MTTGCWKKLPRRYQPLVWETQNSNHTQCSIFEERVLWRSLHAFVIYAFENSSYVKLQSVPKKKPRASSPASRRIPSTTRQSLLKHKWPRQEDNTCMRCTQTWWPPLWIENTNAWWEFSVPARIPFIVCCPSYHLFFGKRKWGIIHVSFQACEYVICNNYECSVNTEFAWEDYFLLRMFLIGFLS